MATELIRLLYIEDDELDRMAFDRYVRRQHLNYEYDMVDSVAAANKILTEKQYDAILLDYNLGDGTAFDIIERLDLVAVILMTGLGDEQIAAQSIKLGAFDYLIKDTSGDYLAKIPATLEQAIRAKKSAIAFKEHYDEIENLVKIRTHELSLEIEERKKAELALLQMNNELEERVQKRTEMLTQSILVLTEAQNQLIESERVITVNRLMNNLSQKINTPVGTNITLSTYLLEENQKLLQAFKNGELTKSRLEEYFITTHDALTEIQHNLHSSASLVEKFKEFNKRKLMDEITDFSLGSLVQEVIQLLSTKLSEVQLTIISNIQPNLSLHNYPSVLRHVIFNLLMHAVSNTDTSKPHQVSLHAAIQGDHLLITYTDNLTHFSLADLSEAFDTFYVLNHGDKAKYIELNTVYMLIQDIEKGHICIDPLYLEGNRMDIAFPSILEESNFDIDLDELIHQKR